LNGLKHGRGKFTGANGETFRGMYENDKKNGKGVHKFVNNDIYEGEFVDGKKHGSGVIKFSNGDVFEGHFENDVKANQGIYKFANGNVYVGEWMNDKRHGQGKHSFASGNCYEGAFFEGMKHGTGIYTYANGDCYSGNYQNEKKNGRGVYSFSNGDVYDGEWKYDQRNGSGVFTLSSGDTYEGMFMDGMMHGEGTFRSSSGDIYTGELQYGKKQGKGKQHFADGDSFEGDFVDDKMHGFGTYTFVNGDTYVGEVKNDQLEGRGNYVFSTGESMAGEYQLIDNASSHFIPDEIKLGVGGIKLVFNIQRVQATSDMRSSTLECGNFNTQDIADSVKAVNISPPNPPIPAADVSANASVTPLPETPIINTDTSAKIVPPQKLIPQDSKRTAQVKEIAGAARRASAAVDSFLDEQMKQIRQLSEAVLNEPVDGEALDMTPTEEEITTPQINLGHVIPIPEMCKGYIMKSGGSIITNWKNRYFVLLSTKTSSQLIYYVSPSEVPPYGIDEKGRLNMKGRIVDARGEYVTLKQGMRIDKHDEFKMHIKDPKLRQLWIEKLNEHIQYAEEYI